MKKLFLVSSLLLSVALQSLAQTFSLKDVLSYPFPSELTAARTGERIAWAVNEQGKRNIYVAEGPDFKPLKITNFSEDDGQEITSLSISDDGRWITFVRGGDHGSREGNVAVNAASMPSGAKVVVCSVPFEGGKVNEIAEGDKPVFTPDSKAIVFIKGGQVMTAPADGSSSVKSFFYAKGVTGDLNWSPDGSKVAFVSSRGDHSFIGIYENMSTPIKWVMPSFSRDLSPRWSDDGNELIFIRTPGAGGQADSVLSRKIQSWAIWKANIKTGSGVQLWKSPDNLRGSFPAMDGAANLYWAGDRIVFSGYEDGWPHLYSMATDGKEKVLLTPGNFAVEHVRLSKDKKWLVFAANGGINKSDIDRRHIYRVSVGKPDLTQLTFGDGMETYPVVTADKSELLFLSGTAARPLLPAKLTAKKIEVLDEKAIPTGFPVKHMVTPTAVTFKAEDGTLVYGQLFNPTGKLKAGEKRAAIVYVHGGPQRQMLLGWHHMDYYSIDYALNQYLTSLGFVVLSVNYRLSTGYGYDFHKPLNAGAQGASEYLDVKAAGEWLKALPEVDPARIGIYGGSYGGYLVALALGKDSKLFAAGVDIHGVNNRFSSAAAESLKDAPDAALAERLAISSSPMSYLKTWKSPVLIIHADDDRNVNFSQSVDLARRFEQMGFAFEYLAIPDDTHHWMLFNNAVKVSEATAEFLKRKLRP
ncbi:MAG: S9 family peptidase [Pedobacter sp.]|nr:MAG: S9 family peptidase [Pedobacter sp.]